MAQQSTAGPHPSPANPSGGPLVECVPNFSEGRNPVVIEAIGRAMASVPGVRLLHRDSGAGANRTVLTLAGPPGAIVQAAFAGIEEASLRIDMRRHKGVHPRLGATDVCPIVPLRGISLDECAELARELGRRVGEELGIPVYLYEAAASAPERRSLARLRAGEYEGLPGKLARLAPDFGPGSWSERVARTGAAIIGARPILVAWNLSLDSLDEALARRIAARIRSSGERVLGVDGMRRHRPGLLPQVRAIGWTIPEYGRCQVSTNLLDWRVTPPFKVVETVRRLAEEEGTRVTGSELVGLVPEQALLAGTDSSLSREQALVSAIRDLGLEDLRPFDPERSILERALPELQRA